MKNSESGHEHHFEWSKRSLAFVIGLLITISAFIVLSTAPFAGLLGPSAYALGSALHGMMAFFLLVVSTIALYLAWRLFVGRIKAFPDLQLVTTVMATLTFLTIVFGNWVYIPYRAKTRTRPAPTSWSTCPKCTAYFSNSRSLQRFSHCRCRSGGLYSLALWQANS